MSRHINQVSEPSTVKDKKVIVLSFPRNGTMGLMHALEILGYKPYHMKTVFETGASHINILNDGIRAKYHGEGEIYGRHEFDKWLADYDAILDVTSFFALDLIAAYPDAKFILTTRNPQRWVQSVNKTMLKMASLVTSFPVCYMGCMSGFMAAWVEFGRLAPRHVWKDKPLGDDAEAIKTYNDHNALIKAMVPKDRLLVVSLEDGLDWKEICPFLGHDIPHTRYPRGNEPKEFVKLMNGWIAKGVFPLLATTAAIVAPVIALSWYR
ncbi:hypothetical protein MGN70_007221 [Eutypa lata]|nr:hypothetical protein MGN70_007221 [Eutypa lata]